MRDEVFIFPYEKVKKGSRVLLYGMGNVGRSYYYQITKISYCEVVAFIDESKYENNVTKFRCIPPNEIANEIATNRVDYIVVAIDSAAEQARVLRDLVRLYNIDKTLIVTAFNRKVIIGQSDFDINTFIKDIDMFKKGIDDFLRNRSGQINYFDLLADEVGKLSDNERERVSNTILEYYERIEGIVERVVILRMLYKLGLFSSECMQLFFEVINQIESVESRIWLTYDIAVMELLSEKVRNEDFYNEKRALFKRNMWELLPDRKNENRKKIDEIQKVAVITFGLGGRKSSHNGLIVPYVNEMAKQGKDIVIFPCQLLKYRYGECCISPITPIETDTEALKDEHNSLFDKVIKIEYNLGSTMKKRAEFFANKLDDFSPDMVVDFCGEYSFYSPLYVGRYWTVAIPMRGYSSSACFDFYLSRDKTICIEENKMYHSMELVQIEEGLVCSLPVQAKSIYKRDEYDIDKNAFVIVTVGARLNSELSIEFVDTVAHFLEVNDKAIWLLVGEIPEGYIKSKYGYLYKLRKIIDWGYERDLMGMYNLVDVYWNPNRMGAGGSMGMAMRSGIPLITTTFPSDVLPRLGIENAIDGDYADCENYAQKLYEDKDYWQEKSKLMKARMEVSSVSKYVEHIFEVVESRCINV